MTLIVLTTVLTVTACGGDDDGNDTASPSVPPTTEVTATTTPPAEPTPTPEPEPAADIAVDVQPLEGGNDYTTAMYEEYTAFETALWASLASGEITTEMRELAGPDVITGLEQSLQDQPRPLGGTVTVTATLDDITVADIGFGPTASEASLVGCSDQSQVEFGDGVGASSGFTATVAFDMEVPGYVVQEYILGTEAC